MNSHTATLYAKQLEECSKFLGLPKEEIDSTTLFNFIEDSEYYHEGHAIGGCFTCKMD